MPTDPAPAPPALQAVLFDMDGLLVDTEPLWFETESEVMARLGAPWTKQDQERLLGGSMKKTVAYIQSKATKPADPAQIATWMIAGMLTRAAEGRIKTRPGARELVQAVASAGIPYALVTSSDRDFAEAALAGTKLPFEVTVTSEEVAQTKPAPDPYLLAAKLLDATPESCVALEDSPNGVASATAAGCKVVAVPSLTPIPEAPGRLIVPSLSGITLDDLRRLVTTA